MVSEFRVEAMGTAQKISGTLENLADYKRAIKQSRTAGAELYDLARDVEAELVRLQTLLTGDDIKQSRSQVTQLSIMDRIQNAVFGTLNQTYGPTQTHRRSFEIAQERLEQLEMDLATLRDGKLEDLYGRMEEAGIPWSAGRPW